MGPHLQDCSALRQYYTCTKSTNTSTSTSASTNTGTPCRPQDTPMERRSGTELCHAAASPNRHEREQRTRTAGRSRIAPSCPCVPFVNAPPLACLVNPGTPGKLISRLGSLAPVAGWSQDSLTRTLRKKHAIPWNSHTVEFADGPSLNSIRYMLGSELFVKSGHTTIMNYKKQKQEGRRRKKETDDAGSVGSVVGKGECSAHDENPDINAKVQS